MTTRGEASENADLQRPDLPPVGSTGLARTPRDAEPPALSLALAEAAKAGDSAALAALWEEHRLWVEWILRTDKSPTASMADLLRNLNVRVRQNVGRIAEAGDFQHWLRDLAESIALESHPVAKWKEDPSAKWRPPAWSSSEIEDLHLAQCFLVWVKSPGSAARRRTAALRAALKTLGISVPERHEPNEELLCVPATKPLVSLFRWINALVDSNVATLPSLTIAFTPSTSSDEDVCTIDVADMADGQSARHVMRASASGWLRAFLAPMVQMTMSDLKSVMALTRWVTTVTTKRQTPKEGQPFANRIGIEAIFTVLDGKLLCRVSATGLEEREIPEVLRPLEFIARQPDVIFKPLFRDLIDYLRSGGEIWQADSVDQNAPGDRGHIAPPAPREPDALALGENFAHASATTSALSLSDLVSRLVPAVSSEDVRTLQGLVAAAQITPPSDKAAFVRDVNVLLEVLSLRVKTDDGDLGRLVLDRNGQIGITRRGRGGSRGFKNTSITLVPVPRVHAGNRHTGPLTHLEQ